MKVCYLTSDLSHHDGWGRYSLKVVEGALRRGLEPVVLTSMSTGQAKPSGVEVHPMLIPVFSGKNLVSLRMFGAWSQVRRYATGCDLVHCLVESYAPLAALGSWGRPYVISGVGTYAVLPLRHPLKGIGFRFIYKNAAKVVCISEFTRRRILEHVRLDNTMVIPLGVDSDFFQSTTTRVHDRKDFPLVLSVGALKPRKGYDVSIRAIVEASKAIPNLRYVIVGDPGASEYVSHLRALITELGLDDVVSFLGQISETELRDWYHRCDLFLLTPVQVGGAFEGFGLVYLEAGACGKPVVGSRSGGVPDAVLDGQTGLLAPEGDVKATADAIVRLLSDPDLSSRFGRAGQERARELSWEAYAQRLERVYQDVLAQRSRRK
ncbi:MAG: glycosyltransferase family 4 protein [Anaerolineae bacterium]